MNWEAAALKKGSSARKRIEQKESDTMNDMHTSTFINTYFCEDLNSKTTFNCVGE